MLKETFQKLYPFDWLGIYKPYLSSKKANDLLFERVSIPQIDHDPVKHRIQVSFQSSTLGRRIYGYGESNRETVAYEKAICELIERETLYLQDTNSVIKTTNGMAAHRFSKIAALNAKLELIERDAFLRHWLTRTPLSEIPKSNDSVVDEFKGVFNKSDHDLILCETFLGFSPTTIAIALNRKTKGFRIGSSGTLGKRQQRRKAVGEAFFSLFVSNNKAIDWNIPSFSNHAHHWYFEKQMPDWFYGTATKFRPHHIVPNFEYVHLRKDLISVVCARSQQLINLWAGTTDSSVNQFILSQYGIEANLEYHPFP